MKGKDKNSRTSLPDLLKYIENKMSGKERNSLEREFQKDPFTEEAEKGLSGLNSEEISHDMAKLQKRLRAKTTRRHVMIFYRIAASVAVLMILSSVFIIVNRNKVAAPKAEIAYNNRPPEIIESKTLTEPQKAGSEVTPVKQNNETVKEKVYPSVRKAEDKKSKPDIVKEAIADETVARFVPAVVTDSISLQEAREVNSEVTVKPDSELKKVSEPSPAVLNETVVVGYGVKRAKDADEKTGNTEAEYKSPEPIAGRKEFDKYIEENIKKPVSMTAGEREVVVISFTVSETGSVENIRVLKTPGDVFSKEAERLIKDGPAWKPAEKNGEKISDEIRIRIVFK
jgi:TonB family protein